MAALLAVLLAYLIFLQAARLRQIGKTASRLVVGLTLFAGLFWVTDQLTGNLLSMRFKGEKEDARLGTAAYSLDKATSGRTIILKTDLMMFLDHPLWGVGLGESNVLRPAYGYRNISHLEQSRLLAEHGIFGLVMLLWLIFTLAKRSLSGPALWRFVALAFCGLAFLTMFHSATRLAMVGFIFGLGLIHLYENHSLHRQSPQPRRRLSVRGREFGAPLTT